MKSAVSKWGNSLALRLPRTIAQDLHFHEGTTVELKVSDECLTVRRTKPRYRLDDLLAETSPENTYGEINWGDAAGKEVW